LDLGGAAAIEGVVEQFGEFEVNGLGGEGGGEEVEWIVVQHLVRYMICVLWNDFLFKRWSTIYAVSDDATNQNALSIFAIL